MQRAIKELEHMDNYDYIIKNESVEESVKQFLEIIEKSVRLIEICRKTSMLYVT